MSMLIAGKNPMSVELHASKSGVMVSEIGLGAYQFTSHWHDGPMDEQQVIRLIHRALDNGITLIDTSEMHQNGELEHTIGKAVRARRDDLVIVTKGGFTEKNGPETGEWEIDASAKNLKRAVDSSLSRLGTDYIDYYLSHFPDPKVPLDETIGELRDAKESGKILDFGFSNYSATSLEQIIAKAPETAVFQHHYSLLDRAAETTILPLCQKKGTGFMAYRVLERGLLCGGYSPTVKNEGIACSRYDMFREPFVSQILGKVKVLTEVAENSGHTPSQVAIRWVLAHAGVSVALVGISSESQLMNAVGAMGWQLDTAAVEYLEETFGDVQCA